MTLETLETCINLVDLYIHVNNHMIENIQKQKGKHSAAYVEHVEGEGRKAKKALEELKREYAKQK